MSIKIQYNKQLLEKLCLRDECIVDFTTIEKYNRDIKVNFTCKCGNTHNKIFRVINYSGGFCKICTNNNKQKSEYQEKIKCPHGKRKSRCYECGGSALCKSSWCHTRAIPKYNNYCLTCCINICPEIQVSRNYKTKEKEVVDRIKEKYPDFTWIHDKKVEDGCSKRRPDLLLDMGYHIIIVEVDENKHTSYDCSCENKRLMELSQDLQHRPIVFIRFNPDSYINQNKLKISSCWRTNKLGVIQIIKTRMTEWKERINILNQQIQYWIDNKSNKTIELFYDNYL